ncbi:SRPBCC family protein [Qipengyuania qiaonensis]|uniref:SRPBCC family protein n=1 Tax=Qipengyuania qiaonensis TaxID=2867240 RepID=A0ABS7JDN4_9SPHN|nr:SRPBCC family protein [Qipengyuania qiaonensis]MBX7483072.1 SRPBCC family protein [Qipengyuania qiaonensis]
MELRFRVFAHISKPVHEVFEAVADPDKLSCYFTTGGAVGRLEEGKTVTWDFHDFPGTFPVHVIEVVPDERIVLEWQANEPDADYNVTVTMTFKPVDGEPERTLVEIAEEGWRDTEAALKGSYGNCMGWSQMLAALKAWVEYDINLRDGMYK